MNKLTLGICTSLIIICSSSYASGSKDGYISTSNGGSSPYYNAQEKNDSNHRGGNSPYYNAEKKDNSNYRGGNDAGYNSQDNKRTPQYGDNGSYKSSNGMIYNK